MLNDCGEMLMDGALRPRLSVTAGLRQKAIAVVLTMRPQRVQNAPFSHMESFVIFVPESDASTINPPCVSTYPTIGR